METFHEAGVINLSAIPAAPVATSGADGLAPLRFPLELRLTPEQFALVCAENREAVLELAADGSLVVIPLTGSETGARNTRLEMRTLVCNCSLQRSVRGEPAERPWSCSLKPVECVARAAESSFVTRSPAAEDPQRSALCPGGRSAHRAQRFFS